MSYPAQQSLSNFYQSVKFSNPRTAALMHADLIKVAIFATTQDVSPAQESADNLRNLARDLPEVLKRVLENSLQELGFPDSR